MMDSKNTCINRLEELIKEGESVLHSKGKPHEIVDRNAKSRLSNEAFWHGIAGLEETQSYLNCNKHLYTSLQISIDNNYAINWINQVYRCILRCLGKNDKTTADIEFYTRKTNFEKNHIERVLAILTATKVAIENGDIEMVCEIVDIEKKCVNCNYLMFTTISRDNKTVTKKLPLCDRSITPAEISKEYGYNTNKQPQSRALRY